jgi:RNA polymerase sigma-70 factor (ECF subfamily)
MYTIAHRTCLDELRRRRRAKVRISADGNLPREPSANISGVPYSADAAAHGADGGEGAISVDGIEDAAASEADHQAVARGMRALASLPESQRQAVLLTKIHGRTTAEAANIVGISVGAIKLRAHRGYVTLRKVLGRSESSSEIHDRA